MLPAWVCVITAGVAGTGYTFRTLYPAPMQRMLLAVNAGRNPALVFLYGKLYGDSVGALTAWPYAAWAAIFAALMSIFIVLRHTRADEETGRLELIGSAAVGRHAPLSAALGVAGLGNAVLAVLLTGALILVGLPAGGSAALALAARRDYGAGLIPARRGRPGASALLAGPFSLAWRLQGGALAAWVAGFLSIGAVCGAAGKGIGSRHRSR